MAYKYDPAEAERAKKQLEQQVLDIANNFKENPDTLIEFAKFNNKFYQYSPRNTMLIYQQNRGAMFCSSFKDFNDMGYSVKKGEHGMKILVPVHKTYLNIDGAWKPLSTATPEQKKAYKLNQVESKKVKFFKVGTVFDIAQTTCPSQDYPKFLDLGYSSEQHKALFESLKRFCESELNYQVNESAYSSVIMRGLCNHLSKEISISSNFNDTTKLSILTHEAGHAIIHSSLETMSLPTYQKEFEADVVSIMLQDYMGVEIPNSRKQHLSDCYKAMISGEDYKPEHLAQSFERANKAYGKIIKNINQELRPDLIMQNQSSEAVTQNTSNTPTASVSEVQPILPNQLPDMGGFSISM